MIIIPKILVDNTKKIQPERTYAIKTCPVCGSIVEIFESEVRDSQTDERGVIQFKCPCGKELTLYKYFRGKQYNDRDYLKCVDYFQNEVKKVIWDDLRYMTIGYRTKFFVLNHTELIINPINIYLKVYIDFFENGNWGKCIAKNEFYKEYKFNLCLLSSDFDECSRYSQALMDYIIYAMKNVCLQVKNDTDLRLQVIDEKDLIAYFRNADMNIEQSEIDLAIQERLNFIK